MKAQTGDAEEFIARHATELGPEILADQLVAEERLFQGAWKALERRPGNISSMFQGSLSTAGMRAALDPADPLLHQDMLRAARSAVAMAEMIKPGLGPVIVDVGLGSSAAVPRLQKNDVFNAADLQRALFAAMIARDAASIEALARLDARSLQTPGTTIDAYVTTFVEFLQALLTGSPAAGEKIVQAMAETDPAKLRTGTSDYALYIAVGEIDSFYGLSIPDDAALNEKLATALINHRKYYEHVEVTRGRSQRNDPRGLIALGPLAAASFGHDRGRSITVRSDYLPVGLVDGRFAA